MIHEKNISFFMIDFKDDKWLNIDSNNNLNKIVNDKHKRFEKTNVAMSLLNSTFMKLICNVKLLSSSTTLKQITYLKIENRFAEIRIWKIKNEQNKNRSTFYSFQNEKEYALIKWFYELKLTKDKVDVYS